VPLEQIPDYVIQAVLATEDRRFFEHWGIDPIGTMRALTVNARGGGVEKRARQRKLPRPRG
jgi:penicillin-binding protein 1A